MRGVAVWEMGLSVKKERQVKYLDIPTKQARLAVLVWSGS